MNTLQAIAKNKLPGAAGEIETFAMANCLMLLSSQQNAAAAVASAVCGGGEEETGRSYPCKTCGRKFPSFQALGGHRASHKKIKPPTEVSGEILNLPAKPKVHACSICGVEFPIGQALGGHMRRHRGLLAGGNGGDNGGGSTVTTDGSSGNSDGSNNNEKIENNNEKKRKMINDVVVPVLKKSSSSKRVCLDLDLSLTLWNKSIDEKEDKQEEEETIVNGGVDHHLDEFEVEEGEIVEGVKEDNEIGYKEDDDFLKLELRLPSN